MRILEVNGVSLLGATHQEAVNALRAAGNEIQIIVCKGYDKSSLIHSIGSTGALGGSNNSRFGSRTSETGSELSHSVSSLDREDGVDDSINTATIASVIKFYLISSRTNICKYLISTKFFFFFLLQTNEVFENKNERSSTPEPLEKIDIDERVTVTSQDVALFNSDQALVSTREKSTKDKVSLVSVHSVHVMYA